MALAPLSAGWLAPVSHHPHQSFVPFRKNRSARQRLPITAVAAAPEPDSLPLQLEQVGVPSTFLLAAAAAVGARWPKADV